MKKIAAIILAGGKGERLYPLTKTRAKPAVTFAGRIKLIDIPIHHAVNAGIEDIYVLTQHLSESIQHHLHKHYPKVHLLAADKLDTTYAGTADAVRKTLSFYAKYEYVLILSGDQIYEIDFQQLLDYGVKNNADVVIASLPVSMKDASRLGVLNVDSTGQITDFVEKPKEFAKIHRFVHEKLGKEKPILGSMGIYLFRQDVLTSLLRENHEEDFGKHLIPKLIKKHRTFAYIHEGYWEDIGTIASYWQANLDLTGSGKHLSHHPVKQTDFPLSAPLISQTKMTDSIICESATIFAKEISKSVIGSGSEIDQGSILENCILCGKENPTDLGGRIGKHCIIKNAIIDSNAIIGNSVHLINKKKLKEYEDDAIVIKDGVIIVKANSKIPDGFIL